MTNLERIEQVTELLKAGIVSRQYAVDRVREIESMADVPAAAPPAAVCKAPEWCGKKYGAYGVPFRRSCGFPMYFAHGADFKVNVKDDEQTWCSIACRDSAPPLAAQPAEECGYPVGSDKAPCVYSRGHGGRHWPSGPNGERASKPAPQPAPACAYGCSDVQANAACPTHGKPVTADCPGCRKAICIGEYLSCREVAIHHREPLGKTTLTESKLPERLERHKLAHSSMWADEAEDVR
jgi:hypothetical protein